MNEEQALTQEEISFFEELIEKRKKQSEKTLSFIKDSLERELVHTEEDRALNNCLDQDSKTREIQLERAKKTIFLCENALKRIHNNQYGICAVSKKPIPKEVLLIHPFREVL